MICELVRMYNEVTIRKSVKLQVLPQIGDTLVIKVQGGSLFASVEDRIFYIDSGYIEIWLDNGEGTTPPTEADGWHVTKITK